MTTERKSYVRFGATAPYAGKRAVNVETLRGEVLGGIAWYTRWRQYVFIPQGPVVFSFDCLEDIAAKVKAMNDGDPDS